jgi:WD40 repeat protein
MLAGSIEGSIAIIDLNQAITPRIIQDHTGAPISSIDSVYKEDKKLTCWLASSRDRRVSVWNSKFNEDMFQMIDWLTFPAPAFTNDSVEMKNSKSSSVKDWFKYPPSLAQFAPNSSDTIVYVGYASQKQILFYSISKKQISRSMSLSEWPECMSISPNCNLIAFGTKSRLLQIKDYNQSTFQDYAQHSDSVSSVCFSGDGKRMFSTSFNEIFIWDVNV